MDKRSFHKVINDFLFGSHELSELDLEFQIALEEKIDNLKEKEGNLRTGTSQRKISK